MSQPFTVAILAGGRSSRMGTDKAFVPFLGRPLIAHVLARIAGLDPDETIIISNCLDDYANFSCPCYSDLIPGRGPLSGLHSALVHSRFPSVLAVAVDLPHLNLDLLRYLLALRDEPNAPYDVIVPRINGQPQGIHAIYGTSCLEAVQLCLLKDQLKLVAFYDSVQVRYVDHAELEPVDPLGRSFLNVNTPAELHAAELIDRDDTPDSPHSK